MADQALSTVKFVFGIVEAQVQYLFSYDTNITNLEKDLQDLRDQEAELKRKIKDAEAKLEKINDDVQTWITRANKIITEAGKLLEDDGEETRCSAGLCINFITLRYKFNQNAIRYVSEISKLSETKFETVSHWIRLPEMVVASSSTGSANSQIMGIQNALQDDATHIIGICGMAGVGKTKTMEEITRDPDTMKKFNRIEKVFVSKNPNLKNIQDQLAEKLGLIFSSTNDTWRRAALWARIKKEDEILIVLDDVWKELDLTHHIGIPYGKDHSGCKIMLTSRNEAVCNRMGAKTFCIKVLDEEESWKLFRGEMAGEEAVDDHIEDIAREVAKECGGLPLVIETVARALRGKDEHGWTNAATQLRTSFATNPEGIGQKVFSSLQPSYNSLGEDEKSLFLLCCLYPKGYHIKAEELVASVVGLRLFGNVTTVEDARTTTCSLLSNLASSFLMVKNKDGYKMHGVVRDFAIHISSSESSMCCLAKASVGLSYWPDGDATFQGFKGISLMHNCIKELPGDLDCPQLQILFLQNNSPKSPMEVPDNFFQRMNALKVIDMSSNWLTKLPPSVKMLTTLTSLSLEFCKLHDISIVGALHQLEILRLSGNDNIVEIPKSFSNLTLLRLFDLRKCPGVKRIAAGVISSMKKLEEFYIDRHKERTVEESRSKTVFTAPRPLSRLKILMGVSLENADILSQVATCQNLVKFDISIGNPPDDAYCGDGDKPVSRILYLVSGGKKFQNDVKILLKRTQHLSLVDHNSVKCFLTLYNEVGFIDLRSLMLGKCKKMKYIVSADDATPSQATLLCKLVYLKLFRLSELEEISHGQLPAYWFAKVRSLEVNRCEKLLNMIPSKLLARMRYLQQVKASGCDLLTHIFDLQELANSTTHQYLSEFKVLKLSSLKELIWVWKGPHHLVTLSNLITVSAEECPKLRQLFSSQLVQGLVSLEKLEVVNMESLEDVFGSDTLEMGRQSPELVSPCLQNLTQIVLKRCGRLRNIFSLSVAKGLVKLRLLVITSCSIMETVMVEELVDTDKIEFPNLVEIKLKKLDSLTCFSTGRYVLELPCLETLDMVKCPIMKTFHDGGGDLLTPKLKKVKVF